jgi:thioredoxin 2
MSATVGHKAGPEVVVCPNCSSKNRVPPKADGVPRCGNCQQPLPWVVDAGESDFAAVADQASIPVVIDIWAPWCGPCRTVTPVLERAAVEFAGRIKLVKVNADDNPGISRRFEVQGIPTMVMLDHGQVVDMQVGAAPAPALRSWINGALEKSRS